MIVARVNDNEDWLHNYNMNSSTLLPLCRVFGHAYLRDGGVTRYNAPSGGVCSDVKLEAIVETRLSFRSSLEQFVGSEYLCLPFGFTVSII